MRKNTEENHKYKKTKAKQIFGVVGMTLNREKQQHKVCIVAFSEWHCVAEFCLSLLEQSLFKHCLFNADADQRWDYAASCCSLQD